MSVDVKPGWMRSAAGMLAAAVVLAAAASALAATATVTVTVTQRTGSIKINRTKHVTLHTGDKLRIAFRGSWYDSGFAWALTLKPSRSVLKYAGLKTKQPAHCCGFPETLTYTYKVVGAGTAELHYRLSGPSSKDAGDLTVSATVS